MGSHSSAKERFGALGFRIVETKTSSLRLFFRKGFVTPLSSLAAYRLEVTDIPIPSRTAKTGCWGDPRQ